MGSKFPDFANELLEKIARENGFDNFSVKIESGSRPGDGFSSDMFRVQLVENGDSKKLELLCKVAPSTEIQRKELVSDKMYRREALFYQHLMPTLAQFQEEKQLSEGDQFRSYPKCYGAIIDDEKQQYIIALEDLRPLGFKMWNRNKPISIENARMTMRELGKFHALSLAFKNQKPTEFKEFVQLKNVLPEFSQNNSVSYLFESSYAKAIDSLENGDHKNIMHDIKNNLLQFMSHCFDEMALDRIGVLCHGDCSNINLLWKDGLNATVVAEEIRFLDWQVCYFGSPAIDVVYNIFTSTDKALRDREYNNLIQVYYDSLSKTVKLLGSDADQLFTFNDLMSELNRCGVYALLLPPLILYVSQADSSEIRNLDEMFDNSADGEAQIDFVAGLSAKGQSEYDRRINEMLEDVTRLGYYANVQLVEEQTRL